MVKFRISSTCNDVKMPIYAKETVASAKKRLAIQESIEVSRQRWFFGGKLLFDRMKIENIKLHSGFVVQVVVSPKEQQN